MSGDICGRFLVIREQKFYDDKHSVHSTSVFLMFSGGIERDQWLEMGYSMAFSFFNVGVLI